MLLTVVNVFRYILPHVVTRSVLLSIVMRSVLPGLLIGAYAEAEFNQRVSKIKYTIKGRICGFKIDDVLSLCSLLPHRLSRTISLF